MSETPCARRRTGGRLSLGRPGSSGRDQPSQRDQPADDAEAVDADVFIRTRASKRGVDGVARPGRKREGGAGCVHASGALLQRSRPWTIYSRHGTRARGGVGTCCVRVASGFSRTKNEQSIMREQRAIAVAETPLSIDELESM